MLLYEKSEDKNLAQNITQHKFYCAGIIDRYENIFWGRTNWGKIIYFFGENIIGGECF